MNQITVYKDGRSMVINDADGALEAIRTSGWTDRVPKGWEEHDVVVEDTIDSLRTENVELVELTQACTAANVDLVKDNKKLSKQVKHLAAEVKELRRSSEGKGKPAKQTKEKEAPVEQEEEKKGESD